MHHVRWPFPLPVNMKKTTKKLIHIVITFAGLAPYQAQMKESSVPLVMTGRIYICGKTYTLNRYTLTPTHLAKQIPQSALSTRKRNPRPRPF